MPAGSSTQATTATASLCDTRDFCGGNEPYESLKRALRADIDEEAWNSLYRTTSRPFPVPKTGRIAVKVINHYGDEVMKVLEVGP